MEGVVRKMEEQVKPLGIKGQKAKALFEEGYNCCQAVVGAYAEEFGLDKESAMALASGMGGGIGRSRSVCGACTGMCLAAGLAKGYTSPKATEEKIQTYSMIQQLLKQFEKDNGSTICKVLLGLEKPEGTCKAEERTPEYYKKRPCSQLVAYAADLLEQHLNEKT